MNMQLKIMSVLMREITMYSDEPFIEEIRIGIDVTNRFGKKIHEYLFGNVIDYDEFGFFHDQLIEAEKRVMRAISIYTENERGGWDD